MSRRSKNKLRSTALLMILSMGVLLFFMGTWLRAQYDDGYARLQRDLFQERNFAEDGIADSLVRKQILVTSASSPFPAGTTNIHINLPSKEYHMVTAPRVAVPVPHRRHTRVSGVRAEEMKIMMMHSSDSGDEDQALQPGITTVIRRINDLTGEPAMRLFTIDSNLFLKKYRERLHKNQYDMQVQWALPGSAAYHNSPVIVVPGNGLNGKADLVVTGFRGHLLHAMLPQFLFSLVLLLLMALSFGISYTNLLRQIRLGQQKDDFISNMSHELKTPVATAKVAIEALMNFNALENPRRTREYLQMAAWEMDRLELLVSRVLNTMQLENGQLVLEQQPTNLQEMAQELVNAIQPRLDEQHASLHLHFPGKPLVAEADQMHLQGALYNLIDNAVKYGGPGVRIDITATERAGRVRIVVADNGPGIAEEYRGRIFEKFFRIPNGNRHDVKGYGLGLNYTRHIIAAHGGSIQVMTTPGGGASFIFDLPLSAA